MNAQIKNPSSEGQKHAVLFSERERLTLHKMLDTNLMISTTVQDIQIHRLEMLLVDCERLEKKQLYREILHSYQNIKHLYKLTMKWQRELESVRGIMKKVLSPTDSR